MSRTRSARSRRAARSLSLDKIFFAPGQYKPDTRVGRALLVTQLAYVVQQREGRVQSPLGGKVAIVRDRALDAEAAARAAQRLGVDPRHVRRYRRHVRRYRRHVRRYRRHVRRYRRPLFDIRHTQGSGKSLTMVWLARWIRENVTNARVLILTDRTELDDQIEKVFKGVNEDIVRTRSGADLIQKLEAPAPWLLCSLIHKFGGGRKTEGEAGASLDEIDKALSPSFKPQGDLYVFVDECHRTQNREGDGFHATMRRARW